MECRATQFVAEVEQSREVTGSPVALGSVGPYYGSKPVKILFFFLS